MVGCADEILTEYHRTHAGARFRKDPSSIEETKTVPDTKPHLKLTQEGALKVLNTAIKKADDMGQRTLQGYTAIGP